VERKEAITQGSGTGSTNKGKGGPMVVVVIVDRRCIAVVEEERGRGISGWSLLIS